VSAPAHRILIVDDEPAIRGLLEFSFSSAGYVVRTAADGASATRLFAEQEFDLVLSDVRMPDMDGHELVRWLAENRPRTRWVLMTGYDMPCGECPLVQSCTVLQKPFRPKEAVDMVAAVLAGKPAPKLADLS